MTSTCLLVVLPNRRSVSSWPGRRSVPTHVYPGKIAIVADDAVVAW